MRKIKLSGRETAILRILDFATGTPGPELLEHSHLDAEDFVDVINGLLQAGYMETDPPSEEVTAEMIPGVMFEVNPAYAVDLRVATRRS